MKEGGGVQCSTIVWGINLQEILPSQHPDNTPSQGSGRKEMPLVGRRVLIIIITSIFPNVLHYYTYTYYIIHYIICTLSLIAGSHLE